MRYYGIVGLVVLLVASVGVYAFAKGGTRRLVFSALALVPVLILIDMVDRLGTDQSGVDWLWVVASAILPLAAASGVRVAAAMGFNRVLQWFLACGTALLAIIVVGLVLTALSPAT